MKYQPTILKKLKNKKTGVFIDGANLFYAQKMAGWRVDFKKLKAILNQEVKVVFFHYHTALPASWDHAYQSTLTYLDHIKKTAVIKSKSLKYIRSGNQLIKKGDVDLEIALDIVRNLQNFDIVIVVSGDSDSGCRGPGRCDG